ncbi:MAG: hypothetical protein JKY34_10795 [Kordiimonadaceae bacterium]|nr:hypothetical protein [Kordiimonadaceae bacterium]
MSSGARKEPLRDVIIAVRADDAEHRDVNHSFANQLGLIRHTQEYHYRIRLR